MHVYVFGCYKILWGGVVLARYLNISQTLKLNENYLYYGSSMYIVHRSLRSAGFTI